MRKLFKSLLAKARWCTGKEAMSLLARKTVKVNRRKKMLYGVPDGQGIVPSGTWFYITARRGKEA
jgi:hypothetical protein